MPRIFIYGRCARAVRREWQSVDDSVLFWKTDLNDDTSLKLALVEKIGELPVHTYIRPKEGSIVGFDVVNSVADP
jgi:hypothetical protein